ncbi:PaaI family thioesterase [Bacteroides finegoldii]|jgi:putative thioesterase|uniref:PaaI family thioesterase n=1 Tax=Bacteroides finegoldii TaxID=338188 RepID=A0A7J4YSU2_9BACE|nr:PaaI family thioesterase [Bacteroides finegoldii]EEX44860.1 thioesterase family protein [Bacteroides finegoldii DSM 17565]KAA5219817.1 PaaI family thioesterase [Bacteroides finegoldii]KAA5223694.1 PaaI family thioesterase [Bacteroides finegoldii]KAA5226041.1 PaaI family thioesterase [Bacteroides finegoldii]KAA5232293.1 PaaI family thioesterase [Bacteroides finegoldii]
MKKIINPWKGLEGYNCFGCAPNNEVGVRMEFYEDSEEIVSIWKPRPEYQGWIDTLHGGIQAVLLDEICAWVVLRKLQTTGVTSKMETRYRKPIDTKDSHVVLRASIKEIKRNIVIIEAKLYNKDGEVCTEAVCTYFTFPQEKARKEMHFLQCDVEPEEILPLI